MQNLNLDEIERTLDAIESFESYTKAEQVELIVQYYRTMVTVMGLEPFLDTLRQFALSNPSVIENFTDTFKSGELQKLRIAIKRRRREITIKRG